MSSPQQKYLEAGVHVLRYIKATSDFGLFYPRSSSLSLEGFTDSDQAACKETRRSIGAYLFKFAGGTITWSSKRQPIVSQSSTEAEYRELSEGAREAVFFRQLIHELWFIPQVQAILSCSDSEVLSNLSQAGTSTSLGSHLNLFCDNQGSINLAKNPIFHARTKHIEVQHHFIRECVLEGELKLCHIIPTSEQPADMLTKHLGRIKFHQHQSFIGLKFLQEVHRDCHFS